jgi:pimeloyl-ACP methyl ester carboxylesterase
MAPKTSTTEVAMMEPGSSTSFGPVKQVDAGLLNVGYAEAGSPDGPAVLLLHGWPYDMERRLAELPPVAVPTITLEGDANGAPHPDPSAYAHKFTGKYEHRTISGGVGHNLPQEAPQAFAQAVTDAGRF